MKNLIALKEFRRNTNRYISEVKKGKTFLVLRRSKPIFTLSSPDEEAELWETIIDFTKMKKGGTDLKGLLSRL